MSKHRNINFKKAKEAVKKAEAQEKETVAPAVAWEGTEDLYIISQGHGYESSQQFKSQISGIYGVKEYYWTGRLEQGPVTFCHKNHHPVPVPTDANHGFTLVGKAKDYFQAKNALVVLSESGDQAYVYIQPDSQLYYVGDDKIHTLYVRIYDNDSGSNNDRWLTLSIN